MNLRQLSYFCAVVDAGSAVETANRLFVAPTAISMQIAQLEERHRQRDRRRGLRTRSSV